MKIENGVLNLNETDLDHIIWWNTEECKNTPPSVNFKEGLKNELFLNGLDKKKFIKIEIEFREVE